MIFVSQEKLAIILLYSVFIGVFLGIVYDVFRIRRLAFRTKPCFDTKEEYRRDKLRNKFENVVIFFEDVFFALISAVVICVFIFYMNSGQVRGIALVGALFGFLLYYMTVGRLVMYFSGVIIGFIKFLTKKIYDYTLRPIKKGAIFIIRHTVIRLYLMLMTAVYTKIELKKASAGYNVSDILKKGRMKNEKAFKHIRKDRSFGVRDILFGDDNKNAV